MKKSRAERKVIKTKADAQMRMNMLRRGVYKSASDLLILLTKLEISKIGALERLKAYQGLCKHAPKRFVCDIY